MRTTIAMILLMAAAAASGQSVYTPANAPQAPSVADMEQLQSVTQYGVTWTFDRKAAVGRFVTGDYYVVGPVTVVGIDPKPRVGAEVAEAELDPREKPRVKPADRVRNGSMLNPPARQEVAYDSGIHNWFRRKRIATPPIAMAPGDSLVSTISLKIGEKTKFPYHGNGPVRGRADNSPVKTAAVLTCVAKPLPADAFRPAFCDRNQTIYLSRNLKRDLLGRLAKPSNTPDLATWVRVFQRPWVNTGFFGFDQPMENMPHYGQWVGQAQSVGGLMLMLDFAPDQKERLLTRMVQVGIDYWGAVKSGHPGWQGWGGHGSGRKFPIVLAGVLLGDERMAAPTRSFPRCNFGEDNQTMYGPTWTGATVAFAGHSGIHHGNDTKKIPRSHWGPYEHLHPKDWDKEGMQNAQSEAYRRANSSSSWPGQALVIRMLGAQRQWNHDAFFDYVDRWMYEDDKAFRAVINQHTSLDLTDRKTWMIQGHAWEPFVTGMWKKHRPTLKAPTDGWKAERPK